MRFEIIEAIEEYYKDDEELLIDCLVYLSNIDMNDKEYRHLSYLAQDRLEDMEVCSCCGAKLEPYTYEEHHTELFGCPIEYITELRCPNCD